MKNLALRKRKLTRTSLPSKQGRAARGRGKVTPRSCGRGRGRRPGRGGTNVNAAANNDQLWNTTLDFENPNANVEFIENSEIYRIAKLRKH